MKKGKFLLFVFILMFCVGFSGAMVYAEEPDVVTTEEVETEVVSYKDQLNDFLDKWSTPIFSIVGGTGSSALVIWLLFNLFKKKLEEHIKSTNNEVTEAKTELNSAKDELLVVKNELNEVTSEQKEKLDEFVNDYNTLVESYKKTFDIQANEIDLLLSHLSVLKDLMCKLVASNPELASNGIATEIMKLCDETDLFALRDRVKESLNEVKEGENNE